MAVIVRPYKKTALFEVDIRFRQADGKVYRKRVRSPVASKTGSQRWGEQRERALMRGEIIDAPELCTLVPTFSEFIPRFIEEHGYATRLKPSVIATYRWHQRYWLVPIFGELRLDEIKPVHLAALKGKLSKRAVNTERNVLSTLLTMLKKAVEWDLIKEVPIKIIIEKMSKSNPVFYDFQVYERLVAAAAEVSNEHLLLVLLGGDAGLRSGEICAAEWDQIDSRRICVDRSAWSGWDGEQREQARKHLPRKMHLGTAKGEMRNVPLTGRLREALEKHRSTPKLVKREQTDTRSLIIRNMLGEPLSWSTSRRWMQEIQERADLPKTGKLHILRHTFCSHLAMRGASPKSIQELAGHQDMGTTMRYMHLTPSHLDSAIALLGHGAPTPPAEFRGEIVETKVGAKKKPVKSRA